MTDVTTVPTAAATRRTSFDESQLLSKKPAEAAATRAARREQEEKKNAISSRTTAAARRAPTQRGSRTRARDDRSSVERSPRGAVTLRLPWRAPAPLSDRPCRCTAGVDLGLRLLR